MSTVQELPLDSPTVPSRFLFKSFASTAYSEDSGHGRSSSAPTEIARDEEVSPKGVEEEMASKKSPVWMNRQAAASTQILHGLGLDVPSGSTEEPTLRSPPAKRGLKQKPNLRVNIKPAQQPDRPPPPPPKSPRHSHKTSVHSQNASFHSRSSSAQSRTSSQASSRASSPIAIAQSVAYQPIKPIFVNRTVTARQSPASSDTAAPNTTSAEVRARDAMISSMAERGRQIKASLRKPIPQLPPQDPPAVWVAPTSRYSTVPPIEEPSAEGERTPKAVALFPKLRKPATTYLNPAASSSSLVVPGKDSNNIPPPTPRKDSFHMQKRSDESTGQQSVTRRTSTSAPTIQPFMPPNARANNPTMQHTAQPAAPARDPPQRPESRQSTAALLDPSAARSETPTPELSNRSLTPEPGASSRSNRQSRVDRPTPELPFRSATPDMASGAPEDPSETLRGLARQTEALHARYTSLRSDRQKLSMSIVSSLREQKPGPQYVNTLLDQHLSLAAINSSMDICFAKLKSLDCRKEEAMTAIIAQQAAKRRHEKLKQAAITRSHSSLRSGAESGRSTPEPTSEAVKAKTSASKLRKDSVHPDPLVLIPNEASQAHDAGAVGCSGNSHNRQESESSEASYKRLTAIQSPLERFVNAKGDEISSSDVEAAPPKKIRIKGAKAAKILGLMTEVVGARPGSPGITLPDRPEPDLTTTMLAPSPCGNNLAIEVHIPLSPFHMVLPPPSPAPTSPLPTPPSGTSPLRPAPLSRKASVESASDASGTSSTTKMTSDAPADSQRTDAPRVASSVGAHDAAADSPTTESPSCTASVADSAADGTEAHAPHEEKEEEPMGLKSARRGLLQTIQVFVDDEILDYYHNGGKK
ncbi:hypothetical protein B0A55_06696 [Friedmanniomyces simplex]|uniref:Up-regulated during septation protein 1 domain-containing protein n=1 Tax=Friedmanniomyces simplex TaxID=329884 RepID=A0A4U0X9Z5_9PEZI|nr:hypothetical protein B0A55_06696 [Friedmanniomyces simplex]